MGYLEDISSFLCDHGQRKLAADATLIGYNGAVSVHKLLLVARSSVFRKMIDSDPDKSRFPLHKYPQAALEAFVNYLYCDELPQDGAMEDVEHELLMLGKLFDIENLVKECEKSIESHVHI